MIWTGNLWCWKPPLCQLSHTTAHFIWSRRSDQCLNKVLSKLSPVEQTLNEHPSLAESFDDMPFENNFYFVKSTWEYRSLGGHSNVQKICTLSKRQMPLSPTSSERFVNFSRSVLIKLFWHLPLIHLQAMSSIFSRPIVVLKSGSFSVVFVLLRRFSTSKKTL